MRVAELTVRRSATGDHAALVRLAQLDSASPPAGEYLLAEEDGALRAALPLEGGRPLADPFHPTADLVTMLQLRARRLRSRAPATTHGRGALSEAPGHGGVAGSRRLQPA